MNDKEMLKRDLDLFESINQGHEEHLKGSESLPSINPLTKAKDVAYVRFSVPDLNLYEDWIHDFGLKIIYKDKNVIYSRGLGGDGFCHVVHKGPAKFLGFAHPKTGKEIHFEAERPLDFDRLLKSLVKASL